MKKLTMIFTLCLIVLAGCSSQPVSTTYEPSAYTDEAGITYQVLPVEMQGDESLLGVTIINGSSEIVTINEADFKLVSPEGDIYEPTNAMAAFELEPEGDITFKLHYNTPKESDFTVMYDNVDSSVTFE